MEDLPDFEAMKVAGAYRQDEIEHHAALGEVD
jgi:hypothetical protein